MTVSTAPASDTAVTETQAAAVAPLEPVTGTSYDSRRRDQAER